jgi:hypothetical protein
LIVKLKLQSRLNYYLTIAQHEVVS